MTAICLWDETTTLAVAAMLFLLGFLAGMVTIRGLYRWSPLKENHK